MSIYELISSNCKTARVKTKTFPHELKKFNWGAFFLTWIWGIGNKSIKETGYYAIMTSLSCKLRFEEGTSLFFATLFVYTIKFFLAIYFGIHGNEWAWENKDWDSVEHFNRVQKIWATIGFVIGLVFGGMFVGGLYVMYIIAFFNN